MSDSKMLRGPLRFVIIAVALGIIIYIVHFYFQWSSAKDRVLDLKKDGTVAGFSKLKQSEISNRKTGYFYNGRRGAGKDNSFVANDLRNDFGNRDHDSGRDRQQPDSHFEDSVENVNKGVLQRPVEHAKDSMDKSENKFEDFNGEEIDNQRKLPLPSEEESNQSIPSEEQEAKNDEEPMENKQESLSDARSPSVKGELNTDLLQAPDGELKILFESKLKLVHLDLKGAPPKLTYLKQIFPLFKQWGANGLLVEYEDTFPYSGTLSDIAAGYAYSPEDIKEIQKSATENGLVIIPLIQTFGHMEFVLKHKKFADFREVPTMPLAISACNPESMQLIKTMISQMLSHHPSSSYLHIGSDEVYHLGMGEQCKIQAAKENLTKADLFLKHAVEVARSVKELAPNVQPIMWDDMLRKINVATLMKYKLADLVEPMVWNYLPDVESAITPEIWSNYAQIFKNVWIASSFKGATGPHQHITDISYHMRNHNSWMHVVKKYVMPSLTLKGIALTGWQRFDHFGVLCELLPSGLPSLAVCLTALRNGGLTKQELEAVSKSLGCNATLPLALPARYNTPINVSCTFPGNGIYTTLQEYHKSRLQYDYIVSNLASGWLSDYNVRYGYASPYQVGRILDRFQELLGNVSQQADAMKSGLLAIFPGDTANEWLEENIGPLKAKANEIYLKAQSLLNRQDWSKRPFANSGISRLATAMNNYGIETKPGQGSEGQQKLRMGYARQHIPLQQQKQQQQETQGQKVLQYGQSQPVALPGQRSQQGMVVQRRQQQNIKQIGQGQQKQLGQQGVQQSAGQQGMVVQPGQQQNIEPIGQGQQKQPGQQGVQPGVEQQRKEQKNQQTVQQYGQQVAQGILQTAQGQDQEGQQQTTGNRTTQLKSFKVGQIQQNQQVVMRGAEKLEPGLEDTIKTQQRNKVANMQDTAVKRNDNVQYVPMRSRQKIRT